MSTIVNNPSSDNSSNAGWIVAAVVLIALVLIALFVWPGYAANVGAPTAGDSTNINVTIPEGVGGDRGAPAGGATGGMGGEETPQ